MDASAAPQTALEAASELPGAPQGWHKKLLPNKAGTPRRRDVFFIAPTGEVIRSKAQLERHLKANPGGPALSDFVWSRGDETPRRRSGRLIEQTRLSTDSEELEPSEKRVKLATPEKISNEIEETETNRSPSENQKEGKITSEIKEPLKSSRVDELAENKMSEHEPTKVEHEPTKDFKEDELTKEEHEPKKDFKEDERPEISQPKEGMPEWGTLENEDVEMKDAVSVTHILESEVVFIANDSYPNEDSIIDLQEEEKCGQKLHEDVVLQEEAADGAKENERVADFKKSKEASLDHFLSSETYKADEHAENVHSEADVGKPQLTSYFGVANPQEAHPSEVGVSS